MSNSRGDVPGGAVDAESRPRRSFGRLSAWVWALAALASITLLVIAILGRDHGDGPTLRAMAVDPAMSDEQARAVADNTIRVWIRERNEGHLANLKALTCTNGAEGTVVEEIEALEKHDPPRIPFNVFTTGDFARHGTTWTLNTHFVNGVSFQFVLKADDGELRACRIAAAPIP